jgi:hypothetical protein
MKRTLYAAATSLALTLLLGQITDKTTGQPLTGVRVEVVQSGKVVRATTGTDGRFRLNGILPGLHTVRYSSADVPPGSVFVRVRGTRQSLHIAACSTTLDYSCTGPGGGGG